MTQWVYLVELTGKRASTTDTYRYATRDYTTAPSDALPNSWYAGRVVGIGPIERRIFAAGESGVRANPRSEVSVGVIDLSNVDGELDDTFMHVSFRERQVRVLRVAAGAAYATAEVVLVGSIGQAALGGDTVSVSIRDHLYLLDSQHQTATYGGTNSLPSGVDGTAELAGKPKPLLYGSAFKLPPPCVNTSRLIYQISARALQSVDAVYDGGVALTAGATYASQADMESTSPAPGEYRAWLAGGMIRLGSSPVYRLTVDATADSAANSTAAQLLNALAAARGITSIDAADITTLDAQNAAVLGMWVDDGRTTMEIMDVVARSVGAWYGFDRLGVLRMQRIALPSGTAGDGSLPVVAPWNAVMCESVPTGEDVPTLEIVLRCKRYYLTQSRSDLAGAVSDADAADLAQQWRDATTAGGISPNPYARTLRAERETAFADPTDAIIESARLFNITKYRLRTYLVRGVDMSDELLRDLDLNQAIELRWQRYGLGLTVGTVRLLIGIRMDVLAQRADLTVWGT